MQPSPSPPDSPCLRRGCSLIFSMGRFQCQGCSAARTVVYWFFCCSWLSGDVCAACDVGVWRPWRRRRCGAAAVCRVVWAACAADAVYRATVWRLVAGCCQPVDGWTRRRHPCVVSCDDRGLDCSRSWAVHWGQQVRCSGALARRSRWRVGGRFCVTDGAWAAWRCDSSSFCWLTWRTGLHMAFSL